TDLLARIDGALDGGGRAVGGVRARISVLSPRAAKGLEFDHVVVADPDAITAQGPRGHHDLYVALTRATRTLTLLPVVEEA
ncbi:ATP-binding domain-containing protein, partial [Kineococcus glutinatus]|uniref:ATP-binding domain-containing protein n=1 Tax=Kineococcus glutinatus TaxID=1070872 RepID=UPI0031EB5954